MSAQHLGTHHQRRLIGQPFQGQDKILQKPIRRCAHLEHGIDSLNQQRIAQQRQVRALHLQPSLHENPAAFHIGVQRHRQPRGNLHIVFHAGEHAPTPRRGTRPIARRDSDHLHRPRRRNGGDHDRQKNEKAGTIHGRNNAPVYRVSHAASAFDRRRLRPPDGLRDAGGFRAGCEQQRGEESDASKSFMAMAVVKSVSHLS